MISISHSPNSTFKQQLLAASFFLPWKWSKWKKGQSQTKLASTFSALYEQAPTFLVKNGRSALYTALKALDISEGDEVIIQAYTCIVVPNSVIWAKAKPLYVDIDASYNIDPEQLENAITPKTKAIIVQHTFGYPANMEKITAIAKKHDLAIIEDCAHALGATYQKTQVGLLGDISIFSFGRDKIISSVAGGAVLTKDISLAKKVEKLVADQPPVSTRQIIQNLLHPLLVPWMTKLMGPLKLGQLFVMISQKIGLLNKVYRPDECNGEEPDHFIQPLPNAMASMALQQLQSLDENLKARAEHAFAYQQYCAENALRHQEISLNSQPAYLRYTIEHKAPKQLREDFRKKGYLLGNWYNQIVMPKPDEWSKIHYTPGSCPKSEELVQKNVNLPTHKKFTPKQRKQMLALLKSHYE